MEKSKKSRLIIGAAVGAGAFLLGTLFFFCLHKIDEGHVGVYYRGGALLNEYSEPGYHLKIPYLTTVKQVQTDAVTNVPCGTKGGVMIYFDKIEVVNYLMKSADQIDESLKTELQQQLHELAPGLNIQSVRVTKPRIPESIRENYESVEKERTNLLVAEQHQKVVRQNAETQKQKEIIEAQKESEVRKIQLQKELEIKLNQKKIADIDNDMIANALKKKADAEFYRTEKEAAANAKLLTKEFLELKKIEAIRENNKIYYGDKIPNVFLGGESRPSLP